MIDDDTPKRQPYGRVKNCRKCGLPVIWLEKKRGRFNRVPVDPKTVEDWNELYDPTKHINHYSACPYGGRRWISRR